MTMGDNREKETSGKQNRGLRGSYGQESSSEKAEAESQHRTSAIAQAEGLHCFFLEEFLITVDHGC